jgi:hypothetical protein
LQILATLAKSGSVENPDQVLIFEGFVSEFPDSNVRQNSTVDVHLPTPTVRWTNMKAAAAISLPHGT